MSIAWVQSKGIQASASSPATVTFTGATTGGNLVTIQGSLYSASPGINGPTAVSDSSGGTNTWHFSTTSTTVQNPPTASTSSGSNFYSSFVAWTFSTASVTSVTVTCAGITFATLTAAEWSGAASEDTGAAYAGAISATPASVTVNLTGTGELVLFAADCLNGFATGPPMWPLAGAANPPTVGYALYKSGSQTFQWATAASDQATLAVAAFKPTSDGGPQPFGTISGGPWTSAFNDDFDSGDAGPVSTVPHKAVWADHLIWGDLVRAAEGTGSAGSDCSWASHNDAGLSVANSILSIIARFESPYNAASVGYDPAAPNPTDAGNTATYTSGIATTAPGFAYTYGYIEALISIPVWTVPGGSTESGIWPSMFTVSRTSQWGPENDVMEFLTGQSTSTLWEQVQPSPPQAYHVGSPFGFPSIDENYHVWGMRWTPSDVTYFLDGTQYGTYTTSANIPTWNSIIQLVYQIPQAGSGGQGSLNFDYVRAWTVTGVPAQPVITSISPATGVPTGGTLTVNFGAVSGATSYRATSFCTDVYAYQQANGGSNPGLAAPVTGASSPLTISGLTNGVQYSVSVAAINGTGPGYSIESLPVPALFTPAGTGTPAPRLAVTRSEVVGGGRGGVNRVVRM